jgi:hypothetical protein
MLSVEWWVKCVLQSLKIETRQGSHWKGDMPLIRVLIKAAMFLKGFVSLLPDY